MEYQTTAERIETNRRPGAETDGSRIHFHDRIVGEVSITEPVLGELVDTPPIRRLAGIDQLGYREGFRNGLGVEPHDRLEHSLGVCNLLREHGADLEEQVAGLLHDVGHGTFSHAIDFLKGSTEEEDYHEGLLESLLEGSEAAEVLQRHGLTVQGVTEHQRFGLLERSLPELCADRLDYVIRDGVTAGLLEQPEARAIRESLTVIEGQWVFGAATEATRFALTLQELNRTCYTGPVSAAIQRATGECLRYALEQGYVRESNLFTWTDDEVLARVEEAARHDAELARLRQRMTTLPQSGGRPVLHKSRVVDPWCVHQADVRRLSEIWPTWKKAVSKGLDPIEISGL